MRSHASVIHRNGLLCVLLTAAAAVGAPTGHRRPSQSLTQAAAVCTRTCTDRRDLLHIYRVRPDVQPVVTLLSDCPPPWRGGLPRHSRSTAADELQVLNNLVGAPRYATFPTTLEELFLTYLSSAVRREEEVKPIRMTPISDTGGVLHQRLCWTSRQRARPHLNGWFLHQRRRTRPFKSSHLISTTLHAAGILEPPFLSLSPFKKKRASGIMQELQRYYRSKQEVLNHSKNTLQPGRLG